LTNYFGIGHTSEPNYCAVAAGDNFGMDNDNFHQIPTNVSTVADLLNTKGISWGEYQEAMPYPGFQGYNYSNQETYANDYVRKHDPLILFDQITNNDTALSQIKNFTSFYADLKNEKLPQWAFITPNMTNDAHDTNVTFASEWLRGFVTELKSNTYFWDNTLLLLTFDESETYALQNRVFSVLLGGAVPADLVGTTDDTVYTHYSAISSVSANWGLPSLGRFDCGANIFQVVANKTGYTNWAVDPSSLYLNESMPGPLSLGEYSKYESTWAVPSTDAMCAGGHGILQAVIDTYKGQTPTFNYTAPFPYDTSAGLGLGVSFSRNGTTYVSGLNDTTSTSTTTTSSSAKPSASKGAAALLTPSMGSGLVAVLLTGLGLMA
jgi:acid phosphatase